MGPTRYFLRCSKCDYIHFFGGYAWAINRRTKWVYSNGSSDFFPLQKRLGWCQECNGIHSHEHIPGEIEIDAFVEDIKGDLAKFESGEWDWYGMPRANYAQIVIKNRGDWLEWSRTRTWGRCLTCGSTHVTPIDPSVLSECKDKLSFAHPGCGGALLFGSDEDGLHMMVAEMDPGEPITYIPYSHAGFPMGDSLDELKRKLGAKHPGAIVELRAAVGKVVSGEAKTGNELTFRSFLNSAAQAHLGAAILDLICRELENRPPDPSDQASLSRRFPEVHKLIAVLIREMIHNQPSSEKESYLSTQKVPPPQPKSSPSRDHCRHDPHKSHLHQNPFALLGVTTRDDRRRIVELAEEKSLELDHDACQKARSDLINPRTRLGAEMSWLSGVSPRKVAQLVSALQSDPMSLREESGLPTLAQLNLLAAAFEAVDGNDSADDVAEFIQEMVYLVDDLSAEQVLRDINEERLISGFPEVKGVDQVEAELTERKRYYRNAIKDALNRLPPTSLVEAMTLAVDGITCGGENHAPELIDELVDSYAVETQGFLQKEAENAQKLIKAAREAAKLGESIVKPLVDKLEAVARNWDMVAQPIQLSAKARGIEHKPSYEIAHSIRSLAIDLFNKHDMLTQSQRLTALIQELFAELPEIAERVEQDSVALGDILQNRKKAEAQKNEWARDITFLVEFGTVFKDVLSISPNGITWKNKHFPLDTITRVRWGAVRHSVNGTPTGTTYTVAFGDNRSEAVVELKKESMYLTFIEKLWNAVVIRLLTDLLETLQAGREVRFGEATLRDDGVTLIKHKYLGAEPIRFSWGQVHIWSANGEFCIGARDDEKIYVGLSYIYAPNTHVLEQAIRMAFKKPSMRRLSDVLR